ncbi:MAG: hypothetical protein LHW59_09665, partial [Candidatus Cloacimonetes bacterium]|nr:hypothetical protein [Candidatus Cloacimonadota bacterium]
QAELATPKVGAACSRICKNQSLQSHHRSVCADVCAVVWAAKLRLAEAARLPEREKDLRPLWQTELATPSFALVSLAEQCPACTVRALAVKRPE